MAEHVAGDLLSPRLNPQTGGNESVLATGWAFLGEEVHSPVDIRQDECERVDNKVDVLTKSVLGLTVACARCHDHKFDAISQRDYYSLSGFVLSSSFRQVRFETMEAHARAAENLSELRAKHTGAIARAFASSLGTGLETVVPYVRASRRVLVGEPSEVVAREESLDPARLLKWVELFKQAQPAPAHPLHRLSMVLHAPKTEDAGRFQEFVAQHSGSTPEFPAETKMIADYTRPNVTPWKTDGPAFGPRPLSTGDLILGTPEQPISRVMTYGAASRDTFWNRLTLTPGTEQDSGSLGAAGRAGKTLRTPKTTLAGGRLHYLIRGKAQVYAGVDSHIMVTGPLHGGLVANFDTAGQLRWVTQDLSAYSGHRVHLEFAPLDESELDVLLVVESTDPPAAWHPVQPWQPPARAMDLAGVADAFRADLGLVVKALESGTPRIEPELAVLADWLVQNSALLNPTPQSWTSAANDYFQDKAQLANSIRWDSPTAVSWADGTGVDENVLIRGKPSRTGAVAPRGLPEAFGQPAISGADTSGRAELADQLVDPTNPLVSRVLVNRVWYQLFGRGIVATVDNFGYL